MSYFSMMNKANAQAKQLEKIQEEYNIADGIMNQAYEEIMPPGKTTDTNPGELEQEDTNTFVINSIEDLVFFSYDVTNGNTYEGKNVKLGRDLDFNSDNSYVDPNRTDFGQYGYNGPLKQTLTSGGGFSPIGEMYGENDFYGIFDGNSNTIGSLYINIDRNENIRAGLFSTTYGEIRNLGLVDVNITVKGLVTAVGGLTGVSYNNIYNSYVTGNIDVTGNSWMPIGGLCGTLHGATIENCYNLSNIKSKNVKEEYGDANITCGGIVGQIEDGEININKCYNKGNITADGVNNPIEIGGIYGNALLTISEADIRNCYNNAKIEGISKSTQDGTFIGGVAGVINSNLSNCYNAGEVIGNARSIKIGGIVAASQKTTVINNIFNIGKITVKNSDVSLAAAGIAGTGNAADNVNINKAYNTGVIEMINSNPTTLYVGSIVGNSASTILTTCYYLKGSYDVGVGTGTVTGVTEIDSIDKFPSVLSVVNEDGEFKEDTNNINDGYPILEWQ